MNTAKDKYEPTYNWPDTKFFVRFAVPGPINAETIPPSRIIEIALGTLSFSTLSAAAKRYWWVNAIPTPIKKFAKQNKIKFCEKTEYAANNETKELEMAAKIKPAFLPNKLIVLVATIAPIAIPTTDIDIGKVDKDFKGLIWDPIIPLRKTVTGAAVKLKTWLKKSTNKFLFIG